MEKYVNFEELGAALRSEREKRHLSIDEVAEQLKINSRLLRALESGDIDGLPHPAYARGFIRTYANFLGLGSDEIQTWFNGLQIVPKGKMKLAPAQQDDYVPPMRAPKTKSLGKGIWIFLLICALGGAGYWLWQSGRLPLPQLAREKPEDVVKSLPGADTYSASRPITPSPSLPPEIKHETIPSPMDDLPGPPADILQQKVPQAKKQEENQPEPSSSTQEPQKEVMPAMTQDSIPEQHKLIITATEECWVHSNADKTDTRQFSLRKGDTFALTFAKNLELKLGNAGGVRLRYDGNDLPPPGTSGQVKTISFPPKLN